MMITIYALKDPDTDTIRYIGQSRDVAKRYSNHVTYAINPLASKQGDAYKQWMIDLNQRGKFPELAILEEVEDDQAYEAETLHIRAHMMDGQLVNARWPNGGKFPTAEDFRWWNEDQRQRKINADIDALVADAKQVHGDRWLEVMTTRLIKLCKAYADLTDEQRYTLMLLETWHRNTIAMGMRLRSMFTWMND